MLAITILLGGCKVSFGEKPDQHTLGVKSEFVERAERTGQVQFDLRTMPALADVGIVEGRDIAIFEWQDRRTIATTVLLPGDARFTFDAAHIDAEARSATGPFKELRLQTTLPDLEAGRDELRRAVALLGGAGPNPSRSLTDTNIDDWYQGSKQGQSDPSGPPASGDWVVDGRSFGDVSTEISVALPGRPGATVSYSFRYGPP